MNATCCSLKLQLSPTRLDVGLGTLFTQSCRPPGQLTWFLMPDAKQTVCFIYRHEVFVHCCDFSPVAIELVKVMGYI